MAHGVGPWKMVFFHDLTWWVDFHGPISKPKKNQFTKPLGPSLGVNRMWTKRCDHAPKTLLCLIYVQKREKLQVWSIFVFSCLHFFSSLKQIKIKESKFIITIFLWCGPLPFSIRAPLLSLPLQNLLDHVSG